MATVPPTMTTCAPDHVAGFYDGDDDLGSRVVPFLADGLEAGDVVVVVATPGHARSLEAGLRARHLPVDQLRADGRYVCFDAVRALAALRADGTVDPDRFGHMMGSVVAEASSGGGVRVFGEMVGLLWEQGDVAAAMTLESLWNDLGAVHRLPLWCAYPATSLADADLDAVAGVCSQHSEVVPPARYGRSRVNVPKGELTESSQLFLPTVAAPSVVRRFVTRTLATWGVTDPGGDAVLVASELATNAVRHASSPFRVTLTPAAGAVRIAVTDCNPAWRRRAPTDSYATGGRGIPIVGRLSTRWGAEVGGGGKTVWAVVPLGR